MGKRFDFGDVFSHDCCKLGQRPSRLSDPYIPGPGGALTNKSVVGTAIAAGPDAQGFEAEDLLQIPVFMGVSGTFLELNRGAIVKRRFRKGQIVCREGEFGSTAFYILEGK